METLRFEMTVDQANTMLEALGAMPYVRVHRLIAQVQAQAKAQLEAPDPGQEVLRAFAGMGAGRPMSDDVVEQAG